MGSQEEKYPLFSMTCYPLVLPESRDIELRRKVRREEGERKVLGEIWEMYAALLGLVP